MLVDEGDDDDRADGVVQQALGSPEGRAASADVPNFAQAGVEMLIFETKDV